MAGAFSRRDFFVGATAGAGLVALGAKAVDKPIAGFDETNAGAVKKTAWKAGLRDPQN
jgi:hypothetical protein